MNPGRLPNFLIVGAARSGTSSLHFYLSEHPDIYMCRDKEPQFFGFHGTPRQVKSKYGSLEEYMSLFAEAGDARIVGEATPTYLALPEAPAAIAGLCPEAKLVASLRNPVDRAFSYYEMSKSKGVEHAASFEDWIRGNDFWLEDAFYAPQIRRYREHFPNEALKIVLFDDLVADPRGVVLDIHRFLGVRPEIPASGLPKLNGGGAPRGLLGGLVYRATTNRRLNRALTPVVSPGLRRFVHRVRGKAVRPSRMRAETRRELTDFFRDDIRATQELLDRDLGCWLGARESAGERA